ncbi:OmpA family protein [Pseudodesulfovibrio sp.]|uniref:OmpA family protein n=1 Tax=Pseudodesulfovibrio sp. TaxID=2035812 RepID=UPI0026096CE4|nr:OmpA family protein [Pseudodesulfovibrio sp.]MDD3313246.1 OmpA family protein [Pseudodesulfovibrio sp.]
MKKAILLAALLALSACGHVDLSITDQTKVYSDSPVRKSSLQVAVHPRGRQFRPLTAYFHPFVIQQPNSDYEQIADAFAEIFRNAWMEDELFTVMEFQPGTRYEGLNTALETARRRGADLLVLGQVPYFYAGNTVDDTAVTIRINIYATGSGDLIWSMIQSGRIEDRLPDDYIYFRHEYRLPQGAFDKIIRSIAKDMAVPLKSWLPDPSANYRFADNAGDVKAALAPTTAADDIKAREKDLPREGTPPKPTDRDDARDDARPQINGVNLDIQFDFDKASIRPDSLHLVDAVGEALHTPDLAGKKIIIAGHTDDKGDAAYNLALSKKRADAVKDYLVRTWSIAPELIETAGYGKSRPISTGASDADRERNRRVEIRLAE